MPDDFEKRFGGVGRLYSMEGLQRIRAAHACVIGIGGVGVWAVEALARSGIGELTLVDLDDLCPSNTNRQLHALDGTYGRLKAEVMAERVRAINPFCEVTARIEFFTARHTSQFFENRYDIIIDAIDSLSNKCALIAGCRQHERALVTTAGAGGRQDPTAVRLADLTEVFNDPLTAQVRKQLRREHGFSKEPGERFGVPCVFSRERPLYPMEDGSVSYQRAPGSDYRLNCDYGFGTSTAVTGAFGFAAAAEALRLIVGRH